MQLPAWSEVLASTPGLAAAALLPEELTEEEVLARFGEFVPLSERGFCELVDGTGNVVVIEPAFTLSHLFSTAAHRAEQRYRLLSLLPAAIEEAHEVWEIDHREGGRGRASRRRRYLTVFDNRGVLPRGVITIASEREVKGMGWRFAHVTTYAVFAGMTDMEIDRSRYGRLVYRDCYVYRDC